MLKAIVQMLIERLISGVSFSLTAMTTEDQCKLHAVMMNAVAITSVLISQYLDINHIWDTKIVSSPQTAPNTFIAMLLDPQTPTNTSITSH